MSRPRSSAAARSSAVRSCVRAWYVQRYGVRWVPACRRADCGRVRDYERVEIGSGKAVGGVIGLLIAKDKFMCATILS